MSLADTVPGFCDALDMPENAPEEIAKRIAVAGLAGIPGLGADFLPGSAQRQLSISPALIATGDAPVPNFAVQSGTGLDRVRTEIASALRAADRGERAEALRQLELARTFFLPSLSAAEIPIASAEIDAAKARVYAGAPLSPSEQAVQSQVFDVERSFQAAAAEGARDAADRIRREQIALDVARRCPQLYEAYGDKWSPEALLAACQKGNEQGWCAALPFPLDWACKHPIATAGLVGVVATAPWWFPWLTRLVVGTGRVVTS